MLEVTATPYTVAENQSYEAVIVFYPQTNERSAALLDTNTNKIIGLHGPDLKPYHPAGGMAAVKQIVGSGLVVGHTIYGFECWHCHDNVYRLGKMPN